REDAVDADELDGGKVTAPFAGQPELLGPDVGLRQFESCVVLEGRRNEIGAFLLGFAREILRGNFDALIFLKAELCAQKDLEFVFTGFELDGALDDACLGQLRFGDFDGKLESFRLAVLSDLQNAGGALLLLAQKLARMAHLSKFEISHGSARDYGVLDVAQNDQLRSGLFLQFLAFATKRLAEDLFRGSDRGN